MLAENLLQKIGFTDEMMEKYNTYSPVLSEKCAFLAKAVMCDGCDFKEHLKKAQEIDPEINEYTSSLFLILECTGYTLEEYKTRGINGDIFYNTMRDITYKIKECEKYKGVFGTFVPHWFEGFLKLERFALGRLQYDLWEHREDTVKIGEFEVKKGDKTIACHIPSSGPLTHESVLDSFKQAYKFFADQIKDGILLIECFSWLLLPEYQYIFKKCAKNTYSFNRNFYIYETYGHEKFFDCWRLFNVGIENCVIDDLPEDTRLQKEFKKYLKENTVFGGGRGAALFDGEKILTRRDEEC